MRARGGRPAVTAAITDAVAWVTLSRGERGNRLDLDVMQGLADACAAIALDPQVRVVVLQASGRDFSLGLPARLAWPPASWPDGVAAVAALSQPVVAAIDGEARGWGFALALAADVRIATARTVFCAPEVRDGRLPGGGLTQRLPRIVGAGRALALLVLGERVRAREAAAWGLLAEVVPPARLARAAAARARDLAARGPVALRYAKEAVYRALDLPLEDGLRLEHDLYVLLQTTADRREGIDAFLARRPPRFGDR